MIPYKLFDCVHSGRSTNPRRLCPRGATRWGIWGQIFLVLSSTAIAQSQQDAAAQKEPAAEQVSLDDLAGKTVQVANSFAARFRNAKGEANGGFTLKGEYKFEPGGVVQTILMRDAWWDTPVGRKTGHWKRSEKATIGVPREEGNGGGTVLYLFENSTLTGRLVLEVGGGIVTTVFRKSPSGLACTTSARIMHEVGAGATVPRRGSEGGRSALVYSKPTMSSCKVQPTG
jgi:hypothetical protein